MHKGGDVHDCTFCSTGNEKEPSATITQAEASSEGSDSTPNERAASAIIQERIITSGPTADRRLQGTLPGNECPANNCPAAHADDLKDTAAMLIQHSLAPASRTTYNRAFSQFQEFCNRRLFHHYSCPAAIKIEHILLYIAHCFNQNMAFSTINTQISGLSCLNKLAGGFGFSDNFVIRKTLQGYQKSNKTVDYRLPITPSILKSLVESVSYTCNSQFTRVLIKAMYLLAFHAFLRIGEITGQNNKLTNCFLRENVSFVNVSESSSGVIHLFMPNFKNSAGKHTPTLIIQPNSQSQFCPVRSLKHFCDMRGHSAGPLFSFMDGSPISRHFFNQQLQLSLKWAGLDYTKYKGHSFRIGAATSAAEMGINELTIQTMGRWHSEAFRKYIRIPALSIPTL